MTLKGYYALCFRIRGFVGAQYSAHHTKVNENRLTLSVASLQALVTSNIRLVWMFAGLPGEGTVVQPKTLSVAVSSNI